MASSGRNVYYELCVKVTVNVLPPPWFVCGCARGHVQAHVYVSPDVCERVHLFAGKRVCMRLCACPALSVYEYVRVHLGARMCT